MRGQVAGDLAPALALVVAREHLARARAEVEAGDVERVDRHALAQHAEKRVVLGQAAVELPPRRAAVARPPDGGVARRACSARGPDRAGSRRSSRGRADARRRRSRSRVGSPSVISVPRLAAVVAAVHADVVLLVEAIVVDGRHHELVDAVADLGILERPVGAKPSVARRPRAAVVGRLEDPVALDDGPEARRPRRGGGGSRQARGGPAAAWRGRSSRCCRAGRRGC